MSEKPPINNIHDKFFKKNLENAQVAQDFLHVYLPESIQALCDFSTLELQPTEFIEAELNQSLSDVLYAMKIAGQSGYVYVLCEHQSTDDALMAFRLLAYSVAIMKQHLAKGNAKLPLVLPIVLYHGKQSPYPHSLSLYECFEQPELAKTYALRDFRLIDLTTLSDQDIVNAGKPSLLFELVLKHSRDRSVGKVLLELIKEHRDLGQWLVIAGEELLRAFFIYLIEQDKGEQSSVDILHQIESTADFGDKFMNLKQYLEQEAEKRGVEQGMQQGLFEGRDERNREVALDMLKDELPIEMICKYTQLDKSVVEALKEGLLH